MFLLRVAGNAVTAGKQALLRSTDAGAASWLKIQTKRNEESVLSWHLSFAAAHFRNISAKTDVRFLSILFLCRTMEGQTGEDTPLIIGARGRRGPSFGILFSSVYGNFIFLCERKSELGFFWIVWRLFGAKKCRNLASPLTFFFNFSFCLSLSRLRPFGDAC